MKRLILFWLLLLVMALTACEASPSSEQVDEAGDGPIVTVYHPPT